MTAARVVGTRLLAYLQAPSELELQVAVAQPTTSETLLITLDGALVEAREVRSDHGGRLHLLHADQGWLEISYEARVEGRARRSPVDELDASRYLRPSRYAESDRLAGLAETEFGHLRESRDLLPAVATWVAGRLSYVLGSSQGTDGAVDTLLHGQGVCRDFAHLAIALLRARNVPARMVATYAPGLDPMDFHAVVEALVDGAWLAADPTLLAPRESLVRIATGRDAADTAFLSNYGGVLELQEMSVLAYVDGDLPEDDPVTLVTLG